MLAQLSRTQIFYTVKGEGFPILMIHGFASDHRLMTGAFEPIFQDLSGWKRIYLDLPGMGKSPAPTWVQSSDDLLKVLLEFIDYLLPEQSFIICGQSYGGYLARAILKQRMRYISGLFLLCPVIIAKHSQRTRPYLHVLKEDTTLIQQLSKYEWKKYSSIAVIQSQYTWDRYNQEFLSGIKICDRDLYYRVLENYTLSENPDEFKEVFNKPTVILTGRQDSVVGFKDHWAIIKNFSRISFLIIDEAGHNLQAEQPEIFTFHVRQWLKSINDI